MVGGFAITHFCSRFLDSNEIEWGDRKFFFLGCQLDVVEVSDNERGMLRKDCGIEMCRELYSKG